MRIGFLSDLHIDQNARYRLCLLLAEIADSEKLDYLVLLGDVGGGSGAVSAFYRRLDGAMRAELRIVAGNHDIYIPDYKFRTPAEVQAASAALYRQLAYESPYSLLLHPIVTERWFITGIGGWYDYSFVSDSPIDRARASRNRTARWFWGDSRYTRGGEPDYRDDVARVNEDLAALRRALTTPAARDKRLCVATHMLPTQALVRWMPVPFYSHFYQLLGSERYRQLYQALGVSLSVSGHSHMPMRRVVDGIAYVNVSLGHHLLWHHPLSARREIGRVMFILDTD